MLFRNIKRLSRATLKCDIVAKQDNYKYLVALYTQHLREQFTFLVYFSLASLFLGSFRNEANKSFHSYSVNKQLTWLLVYLIAEGEDAAQDRPYTLLNVIY